MKNWELRDKGPGESYRLCTTKIRDYATNLIYEDAGRGVNDVLKELNVRLVNVE